MNYLGIALIIIGLLLRWTALASIVKFNLHISTPTEVCTSGIYKYIKHPAYTGSFIFFIGLSLLSLHFTVIFFIFVFYLSRAVQEDELIKQKRIEEAK